MVDNSLDVQMIHEALDQLNTDTSIPRNLRLSVAKAKNALNNPDNMQALSKCIYALDEVVNDSNMPMHARTMIWNMVSEMESLKQQLQQARA